MSDDRGPSRPLAAGPPFAVQVEGLVRRFGQAHALAGVSLAIRKGEFFSLLGPSGCGKTTLLRIIAGLDEPDEGTVRIGGRECSRIPAHQRPVNTVFQSYALFPHMTVRQNVSFGLRMKKVPRPELESRTARAMEIVEIGGLADRSPAQLSGGQKQRVALARAIVNEPEVLLLDEPLGALDLKLRKQLQGELRALQRRLGITFICVTHDQDEALVMSDRIAVMNAGAVAQLGDAQSLYERPRTRFVAQFLGACNLLPATVCGREGAALWVVTELGRLRVELREDAPQPATGSQVTVAIRPEKVWLSQGPEDGPNRCPAVVSEAVYTGSETQYRLQAGTERLRAWALNARAGTQSLILGQRVWAWLPPEALLLLED